MSISERGGRLAAQVRSDTGSPVESLVLFGVARGTMRWGGADAKSIARRYDISERVVASALHRLERKGRVVVDDDPEFPGMAIYSLARGDRS